MRVEPKGGSTIVIPAMLFLLLVCLGPVVSILLGLGALGIEIPVWVIVVAMCVGAMLGPATGYSMPLRGPTQEAKALAARTASPTSYRQQPGTVEDTRSGFSLVRVLVFLVIAVAAGLVAFVLFNSGCSWFPRPAAAEQLDQVVEVGIDDQAQPVEQPDQAEQLALQLEQHDQLERAQLTIDPGWSAEDCRFYDSARIGFTAAGSFLVGVGAAAPTVLAAWPDPTRDETIAIGSVGAACGAIGGLFLGLGQFYADNEATRCMQPVEQLEQLPPLEGVAP